MGKTLKHYTYVLVIYNSHRVLSQAALSSLEILIHDAHVK